VAPAYAIETCTYVLAPFQRIFQEGVAKNTPPDVEVETPDCYNGHNRIYGLDGSLLAKPDKRIWGLDVC
jgi:cyanide hydratase